MTDDALRREAEACYQRLNTPNYYLNYLNNIDIEMLVTFAQAQRAAEVRAFQQFLSVQSFPVSKVLTNWLDQRAKEWEA